MNGDGNGWCFYVTVAVVGGIIALAASRFGLARIGFTVGGVAANSIAAVVQSVVYGGAVAATSIFAALQSAGAAGLGTRAGLFIFIAGAGLALWIMYPRL